MQALYVGNPPIDVVPTETFIATITGEGNRDIPTHQPADGMGSKQGGVRVRLTGVFEQPGHGYQLLLDRIYAQVK